MPVSGSIFFSSIVILLNRYENNNGGPSSHKAAARTKQSARSNYTVASQAQSLKRLHGLRQQLSHSEAAAELEAVGINPDGLNTSGSGRADVIGKRGGNKNAAYQWTADGQALHWCNFLTDERGTVFADKLPLHDRGEAAKRFAETEQARRQQEAKRIETHQRVARQAQDRYHAGVLTGTHEYIQRKQLRSLNNARIETGTGALLIPMWVSGIGLVNLQRIYPDGTKRFLKGARVKGAYSVIGSLDNAQRVLVCEGWATGATLAELYGLPVVIAFNAGNLMSVCQALRLRFDNTGVVLAADDRQNTVNVGRIKAIQAGKAIGARLLFPELCRFCKCSDHNDAMVCSRRRAHG